MRRDYGIAKIFTILLVVAALLFFPIPARADGGPVTPDWELWRNLKEGEQTAVVTINDNDTVHVDLFVSLLDSSGQADEITYFVPLGTSSSNFNVLDAMSGTFSKQYLSSLDEGLGIQASRKRSFFWLLAPGLLASQGAILSPAAFFLYSSGCGGTKPEASFTTDSSQISLFNLDASTDIADLVATTGLDPSVQQTLARLIGQKIAVIKMTTSPAAAVHINSSSSSYGQPGLHLSWDSGMTVSAGKKTFSYPLNTGASWAHPIDLTRVYFVSPSSGNFKVTYPKLGTDYSGYTSPLFSSSRMNIANHYADPGYSTEDSVIPQGHVCRIIYTQSNPSSDIVVTLGAPNGWVSKVGQFFITHPWLVFLLGTLLAFAISLISWRHTLQRFIQNKIGWRYGHLWREAAVLPLINLLWGLLLIGFGAAAFVALGSIPGSLSLHSHDAFTELVVVIISIAIVCASVYLPVRAAVKRLKLINGVTTGRAFRAYIIHALTTSIVYVVFMIGFGFLLGVV